MIDDTVSKTPRTEPAPGKRFIQAYSLIHSSGQSAIWSTLRMNIMCTYYESGTKMATADTMHIRYYS